MCNFYAPRSVKRKKLLELTVFFALLGSVRVKVASKMLVKLTPGFNFTNTLVQSSKCNMMMTPELLNISAMDAISVGKVKSS